MLRVYKNRESVLIPLKQYAEEYCKEAPEGWYQYIEEWVKVGMNINNEREYDEYLKKMNLRWFDYEKVNVLYEHLKKSNYNEMFEDDILRYLAHIYGLGYFQRIKYEIDVFNPNLDTWLNIKNVFKPNRDNIPKDEGFSLIDLLPLKYGMNAIRHQLIFSSKW